MDSFIEISFRRISSRWNKIILFGQLQRLAASDHDTFIAELQRATAGIFHFVELYYRWIMKVGGVSDMFSNNSFYHHSLICLIQKPTIMHTLYQSREVQHSNGYCELLWLCNYKNFIIVISVMHHSRPPLDTDFRMPVVTGTGWCHDSAIENLFTVGTLNSVGHRILVMLPYRNAIRYRSIASLKFLNTICRSAVGQVCLQWKQLTPVRSRCELLLLFAATWKTKLIAIHSMVRNTSKRFI